MSTRRARRHALLAASLALVVILLPWVGAAEIYRYRDERGNWVFTDRPPPGGRAAPQLDASELPAPQLPAPQLDLPEPPDRERAEPEAGAAPAQATSPEAPPPHTATSASEAQSPLPDPVPDLAARLRMRFTPRTALDVSGLAVVTLHSELGTGAGFFVSDDGLLLTNRHLVRPTEDWGADEHAALRALQEEVAALERRLSLPRDRFSDPGGNDRGQRLLRERLRAYRQGQRALAEKQNALFLQREFEIQLKDGESLTAELVNVSPRHDLALLRVHGHRTPHLEPLADGRLAELQRVYAIGGRNGIADTIIPGSYSGRLGDRLLTDTPVPVASSGGPLVTEDGKLVGINVRQDKAVPGTEARNAGAAIPIAVAYQEFSALRKRGTAQVSGQR